MMNKKLLGGIVGCALMLIFCAVCSAEVVEAPLANGDCVKCHSKVVHDVDELGGLHKTAVTCLECHLEHPPEGKNPIPECAMCHAPDVKSHYTLENCIACHYPHYPLKMDFAQIDPVKPICCTCHGNECTQLNDYPSKHTDLDCKECHLEHRQYLKCLECHEPHTQDMKYEDCLRCHNPHMAAVVKYDTDIPNHFCGGCHGKEVEVLAANGTKHHDLACVYCHKDQHKMVPPCAACHGKPHGEDIHGRYSNCLECHQDPHGLVK